MVTGNSILQIRRLKCADSVRNHSYFPHILSCFSHDDLTRKEQAPLSLYYLVKNALCFSQALSLPFIEVNLPYVIRIERLVGVTSPVSRQFISRHIKLQLLGLDFYHPRLNSQRRKFFHSLTPVPVVLQAGWVSQNTGYFLFLPHILASSNIRALYPTATHTSTNFFQSLTVYFGHKLYH